MSNKVWNNLMRNEIAKKNAKNFKKQLDTQEHLKFIASKGHRPPDGAA